MGALRQSHSCLLRPGKRASQECKLTSLGGYGVFSSAPIKAHSRKRSMFEQTDMNSLLSRMHCSRLGHNPIGMSGRSWEREVWKENLRLGRGSRWPGDARRWVILPRVWRER